MDHPQAPNPRVFQPHKKARYGRPTLPYNKLVRYNQKRQFAQLMSFPFRGAWLSRRNVSLVVAVDGGSRGNNRSNPDSKAAYGVYFGHRACPWNRYGCLDSSDPQTSSRSELEAVSQALQAVAALHANGRLSPTQTTRRYDGIIEVIIKLDSDYVTKTMSEYIWTWMANGGFRTNGKPAEHFGLIRSIHEMIRDFEENKNISVQFWRVDREFNQDADRLVNMAFDETGMYDSGYSS